MLRWPVREVSVDDLRVIGSLDRSEHVDIEYEVVDGVLTERPVTMSEIPDRDHEGTGPHSVHAQIEFCRPLVEGGAVLLGVFDGDRPMGLAIVDPDFEPPMAWFAYLHVNRADRRRGVAQTLWDAAAERAWSAGATSMYVSAIPTGSAIGFYSRQGCVLARPPHPRLFAMEPEDIHLVLWQDARLRGRALDDIET